jgi:hypothetical protein
MGTCTRSRISGTVGAVNRKLTDQDIEQTWRALRAKHGAVSGRGLREALRARFGTPGRTDRVFEIWRILDAQAKRATLEPSVAELHGRVEAAEARAVDALNLKMIAETRAALAEAREVAHQDRWADEIHALRQEVARLKNGRLPM